MTGISESINLLLQYFLISIFLYVPQSKKHCQVGKCFIEEEINRYDKGLAVDKWVTLQ